MIVTGIMSGTSADGINVALVKITESTKRTSRERARRANLQIKLLGHSEYSYPRNVRQAVLHAMNAESASVADLSRLNFLLAELYAEAVKATQKKLRVQADLAGCHGQTVYHQGEAANFLERKLAVTWQIGEGAVVA